MTNRTQPAGGSLAVADTGVRELKKEIKAAKRSQAWTMTPVQATLGRRVGFRNHWKYWASGLGAAFVAGILSGIKIGHQIWRRKHGESAAPAN